MKRALLFALVLAVAATSVAAAASKSAPTNADHGVAAAAKLVHEQAQGHRLLLLGEMHGTREAPALLGRLAAGYADEGPVTVALELSGTVQPAVERYIGSDGGSQARLELLAESYWHVARERSDGRRNLEVLALFDRVRTLRAQGRRVNLLLIDNPFNGDFSRTDPDRNEHMAARVREGYSALPGDAHMLVLTGNAHAMLDRPGYAPPEMPAPMGSYLRDLNPFAVDIAASAGEHWACLPAGCQAVPEQGGFVASGPVGDGAFDYRVVLSRYTLAPLIE